MHYTISLFLLLFVCGKVVVASDTHPPLTQIEVEWLQQHPALTLAPAAVELAPEEQQHISSQLTHLEGPSFLHSRSVWFAILAFTVTVLLVLVSILAWNRTLKRQVTQRTQSLKQELLLRHEAEQELQKAHTSLITSHRELKQTQLQLIHAAKMESIGCLAAGVAHEVKNPLAVIRLGMDYITGEMQAGTVIGGVMEDIETAIRRADTVINSLLDFSRESELNCQEENINRIIENSLHLIRHELVQHNIDVVRTLDFDLPVMSCDANRMQQIFVNLFMNAIQAMQQNGTITISSYQDVVSKQHNYQAISGLHFKVGQSVIVTEVCDTGPGITADRLGKIFDPFYTTKPVGDGTGLGLSVIRNIVDLHQGAIKVENLLPHGLSVKIMFKHEVP